jgi:hypothetical protein
MLLFVNQVRDVKIKILSTLKQDTDEERLEWKKFASSLKVKACHTLSGSYYYYYCYYLYLQVGLFFEISSSDIYASFTCFLHADNL